MLAALERKVKTLDGEARAKLQRKLTLLRPMIAYCRSLPHSWAKYDEIAKNTSKGWGIHAAVLDIDVGPLLQVQKLLDSVLFARAKGYMAPLTAADLELMNAYCRSLPHSWAKYDEIAKNTSKGWGIHAAVLDIDVGPHECPNLST